MDAYYLRTIQLHADYNIPLVINRSTKSPSVIFMYYLMHDLRFKSHGAYLKQISYSVLRFYNFMNRFHINIDTIKSGSVNYDIEIEIFVTYILDSTSRHKQTISYRNLVLSSVQNFLKFCHNRYKFKYDQNLIKEYIIHKRTLSRSKSKRGFSKEIREFITEICHPESINNPFSINGNTRVRNYIIVQLLIETGIRIGELQTLNLNSYQEINRRFYVCIDDRELQNDERSTNPRIKNLFSYRTISISENLFNLIHYYVTKLRVKSMSNALITSTVGRPISSPSIQSIFNKLSQLSCDEFKLSIKLNAHDFRYNFATEFLRHLIDYEHHDMSSAQENLRIIMGWQKTSVMPSKYAEEYILKKTNESNMKRIQLLNE